MFYIIGIGLSDEKDITLRGLEVTRFCQILLASISYCSTTKHRRLDLLHACTLKHTQAYSWYKKSA